jgi:hypothetical protein
MSDIKDRLDKVDDRLKVLIKKYPLVFAATVLGGFVLGAIFGAVVW